MIILNALIIFIIFQYKDPFSYNKKENQEDFKTSYILKKNISIKKNGTLNKFAFVLYATNDRYM